jgi:hypothetical protein
MGVRDWVATMAEWQDEQALTPTNSSRRAAFCVGQKPGSARWSPVESWARRKEEDPGQRMRRKPREETKRKSCLARLTMSAREMARDLVWGEDDAKSMRLKGDEKGGEV